MTETRAPYITRPAVIPLRPPVSLADLEAVDRWCEREGLELRRVVWSGGIVDGWGQGKLVAVYGPRGDNHK